MSTIDVCIDRHSQTEYNRRSLKIFSMKYHSSLLPQRRRSINEGKLSCASMFLLLLEQSKSYEIPSIKNEYSSCMCSMRSRYLKRLFLIGKNPFILIFSQSDFPRTMVAYTIQKSIHRNSIESRTLRKELDLIENKLFHHFS